MKKYLITVGTNWCGMDNTYALTTDKDLYDVEMFAHNLAYENFSNYGCEQYVFEEEFPDKEYGDDLDPKESEQFAISCDEAFYSTVEEVEEDMEDFKDYEQLTL